MKKEQKTEHINIRIEPSIKNHLVKAAKISGRSITSAMLAAIKLYVEKITGKKI